MNCILHRISVNVKGLLYYERWNDCSKRIISAFFQIQYLKLCHASCAEHNNFCEKKKKKQQQQQQKKKTRGKTTILLIVLY